VPAEDYLRGCPGLAGRPEDALLLVYGEALLRQAAGEPPDRAEYRARFPELADALDIQFDLHAALAGASSGATRSALDSTRPSGPGAAGDFLAPDLAPAGYELLAEVGRGGMGIVYRARDLALGREVAIKVLSEQYAPDSDAAARFLDEVRITARLQHPAIPPVHDLGRLPDGRPFLAMKLFRGRTFAAELADRAAQLGARWYPDNLAVQELDRKELQALHDVRRESQAEELRRLTRIFEQVCQAVAFAHSQGVIHRDLKPANIMVAAFGEIQVMDWGLAKRLREPAPAGAGTTSPGDDPFGEADRTRPGVVMGTFAYMPPEQARGESDVVDARADVFALGAILCQVLTGLPPYPGRTAKEVWRHAAAGDLTAATARLRCHADAPDFLEVRLAGLAIRCLAPAPAGRPAHAGEVAVAVTAALTQAAESHRQAELSLVRTDAEMGYGKRGRFAPGLKAVGLLLLFVLIGLFGYVYRAATVEEAKWTAEKEKQLQSLRKALNEAGKEKQRRLDAENGGEKFWPGPNKNR
jgi:serine/threonine-protein kinase